MNACSGPEIFDAPTLLMGAYCMGLAGYMYKRTYEQTPIYTYIHGNHGDCSDYSDLILIS